MSLTISTNWPVPGLADYRTGDPYTFGYAASLLNDITNGLGPVRWSASYWSPTAPAYKRVSSLCMAF